MSKSDMGARLHALTAAYLPEIEAEMLDIGETASPGGSSLGPMLAYHFETGGKRLRALMPLLVADVLGRDPERAIPFGAACEMLHNATLVHDDLQDGDTQRRGRATVWKRYGEPQAINLGDAMFYYATLLLHRLDIPAETKLALSERLMRDTIAVVDGQEREFLLKTSPHPNLEAYFRMVEGKTSGLFGLCLGGAALLFGAPAGVADALDILGRELGVLFQIQDDVLDLYGAKGRGRVGEDVAEGKRSVLVVYALEHLPDSERAELLDIIDRDRDATSSEDIERAKALLESCGAKSFAIGEIERRRAVALRAAAATGDKGLIELAEFLAELFLAPICSLIPSDGEQNGGGDDGLGSATENDDALLQRILPDVSRTFALSIQALSPELKSPVRTAYLLCRILDTIEDEPEMGHARRSELFGAFEAALKDGDAARLTRAPEWSADAENTEYLLCRRADAVFRAFDRLTEEQRACIRPSVLEMSRGMREYSQRHDELGSMAIRDLEDLDRYCYFVAGTVGEMLTELFLQTLPDADSELRDAAKARAVAFGQGLQLVNIVKDVSTDSQRGVSFLPESLARAHGVEPEALVEPRHRPAALAVLEQVASRARAHLDRAIEYTLLWPTTASGVAIRFFCAVPLGLALATMDELERSGDAVRKGVTPKVARSTVLRIFRQAQRASSSGALDTLLDALRRGDKTALAV